jgi:hypothetical protein
MEADYPSFCVTDPVFYDSPLRRAQKPTADFMSRREVPDGWTVNRSLQWTYLTPAAARIPKQGWKAHASATLRNAEQVLDAVWRYCVPRQIPFKFLPDRLALFHRNGKYAHRSGSGKFVTIYPTDALQLEQLLNELGRELAGQPGPFILNDLRWGDGPLYVRYGGFLRRTCRAPGGGLAAAIEDPQGRLVPDLRGPYFDLPPWATVPDFLAPLVAERMAESAAPADFPYQIEQSLHFSNGGGIYLATDPRTGRKVVLREARPYAGLDNSGRDAVQRLGREQEMLDKLAGTGVVPELYDRFTCWEHEFLVEEYIEGRTLAKEFVQRYPLIHPGVDGPDVAEYSRWAVDVLDRVRQALQVIHDHGIAFGDLHPHNIMVRPDGEIRFVDLEVASFFTEEQEPGLGNPAFLPRDGRGGAAADLYALACLNVYLFLPLTGLFGLNRRKPAELVRAITRRFVVPADYPERVLAELRSTGPAPAELTPTRDDGPDLVADLGADLDAGRADWAAIRASIHRAIVASATPEREDRLFPGDVHQFIHNGVGFAFGAAGVLHTLHVTGAGRYPDFERWIVDAVRRGAHNDAIGFFDGLHGVAYALEAVGRRDDALAVLDLASRTPLDNLSASLFDGLAGIGLNLLHFAARTGDRGFHDRALLVADQLVDWLVRPDGDEAETAGQSGGRAAVQPQAGLLRGASGHALFFIRLFEATADPAFLDHAAAALRRDLARTIAVEDGTVQVDEGWRVMPYVATGSAGIGLVINEFLAHRDDAGFEAALGGIRRAAMPEFIIGSGLFDGRAGLIAFLSRLRDSGRCGDVPPSVIERHLRRLAWHAVEYRGDIAFPGEHLLRLSMDVATGSAGIAVALAAAVDGIHTGLPFVAPLTSLSTSVDERR